MSDPGLDWECQSLERGNSPVLAHMSGPPPRLVETAKITQNKAKSGQICRFRGMFLHQRPEKFFQHKKTFLGIQLT